MSPPRIALVTGAAQGIGRAIALRLADDGFDVATNDIASSWDKLDSLVDEILQKGRRSVAIIADVSEEEQVKSMVTSVVTELGGLDVMIANAGILKVSNILDGIVDDWDRIFAVNARGTFLCYKYAAQQMILQGRGGRIIGASSGAGKRGGPKWAAYSCSKFAIRGLTQSAAIEFGKHGITVNAYAPGVIDTDMLSTVVSTPGNHGIREELEKATSVGYLGTPKDVAGLVSYLASKEAHFVTGQSISIDGGKYFD